MSTSTPAPSSTLPHTHTFIAPTHTIVISGPHIQVLRTATGEIAHTITTGYVRCAALDREEKYLITAGEDKMLRVWEVSSLKVLNERELPKRPTKVVFTKDGGTILVADKFGDIFSYPLQYTPLPPTSTTPTETKQSKDALASHENPSGGTLILGHTSLLNAFLLTPDERYIITADRDEHIRVSWFPQGYVIEMYCLGHTKFVSALHLPPHAPSSLISGGGDPALKVWDWMAGVVKYEIPVWDVVEPYVKVRGARRRRGEEGEEQREGTRRGKGKKAKGKGRGKVKAVGKEDGNMEGPAGGEVEAEAGPEPEPEQAAASESAPAIEEAEKVLVVHKIETISTQAGPYIIFSVIGATALFACPYPDGPTAANVQAYDLGRPVVDFAISSDGLTWVSLDTNWSEGEAGAPPNLTRVLTMSSGKFMESPNDSPLLSALNEKCRVPATPDDLKKLDIYGDLTAMPKNTDTEQDQASDAPIADEGAPGGKQVSKKVLGRLKSKKAVLAKVQAGENSGVGTGGEELELKEPETKKSRSERGDDVMEGGDVLMDET